MRGRMRGKGGGGGPRELVTCTCICRDVVRAAVDWKKPLAHISPPRNASSSVCRHAGRVVRHWMDDIKPCPSNRCNRAVNCKGDQPRSGVSLGGLVGGVSLGGSHWGGSHWAFQYDPKGDLQRIALAVGADEATDAVRIAATVVVVRGQRAELSARHTEQLDADKTRVEGDVLRGALQQHRAIARAEMGLEEGGGAGWGEQEMVDLQLWGGERQTGTGAGTGTRASQARGEQRVGTSRGREGRSERECVEGRGHADSVELLELVMGHRGGW